MRLTITALSLLLSTATACGKIQSEASDAASDVATCTIDDDCARGEQCGYPITDGCNARRRCFHCFAGPPIVGCTCDGRRTDVSACGYSNEPISPDSSTSLSLDTFDACAY
jgi:hypothetical protein